MAGTGTVAIASVTAGGSSLVSSAAAHVGADNSEASAGGSVAGGTVRCGAEIDPRGDNARAAGRDPCEAQAATGRRTTARPSARIRIEPRTIRVFLPQILLDGAEACARCATLPWCSALTAAPYSAVYFEGRFVPPTGDDARVPVTDPGYLLGEGVFATLRGYDGACFRPERHFSHLVRGAASFGMTLPVGLERLKAIADEAASRTRARDAYVRVTLTRSADDARPVLTVLSRPLDVPSADDYVRGVSATIVTARRIPPACMDPSVKTTSYAPQVLAKREAASRGVGPGEGIMLAIDGSLACGTMANIFLVAGDLLLTPSLASGCRAGITRETVMELAGRVGLTVREEQIDRDALLEADEAFFTSSRVECLPIAAVDGVPIGRPGGELAQAGDAALHPRTTTLRSALRALIVDETTMGTMSERRGIA